MLSGMDTESKLKDLLQSIQVESENLEAARAKIAKVVDLSKSHDGYTSGPEDEEFY